MDFSNDPEVRRIHSYLTILPSFKSSIDKLEEHFEDIFDVKSKISLNSSIFWTAQLEENKWEVCPKVNVRLCLEYINKSCDGDCGLLHLCKQFLISPSSCSSPCQHELSHNIGDKHNKNIVKNVFPEDVSHWIKIKLLRSSFPRLCKAFIEKGSCDEVFCGHFHICADYISGTCRKGSCNQEIRSGLSKTVVHNHLHKHNTKVIKLFNFGTEFNKDEILGSILMPFEESQENVPVKINSVSSDDGDFESVSTLPSVSTVSHPERVKVKLCYNYLMGCCVKGNCPRLHLCKEFLINGNKCSKTCKYGFSHDLYDEHNKPIIEADSPSCKEISKPKMLDIVRKSFPRVCKDYEEKTCFSGDKCDRLHVCSETLLRTVCTKYECVKSHNLLDDHNSRVLKLYSITMTGNMHTNIFVNIMVSNANAGKIDRSFNKLKSSQKDLTRSMQNISTSVSLNTFSQSNVVASSSKVEIFPDRLKLKICFHYINGNCTNAKCPHLHICKEFLISDNKCKKSNCQYGLSHDPLDEHNKAIIEKRNVTTPTKTKVLHVLRNSFPRVCKDYTSGKCSSPACGKIHACSNTLLNSVCVTMDCCLSHDIQDVHNSKVLKMYSLDVSSSQKVLINLTNVLASILYSSIQSGANNITEENLPKSITPTSPAITVDLISFLPATNLTFPERLDVKLCHSYLNDNCCEANCQNLHLCKEFLVNASNCKRNCRLSHEPSDYHNKNVIDKLCTSIPDSKMLDVIRNSFPTLCKNYHTEKRCSDDRCDKIHICIMTLWNKRCHDDECSKSHDLQDAYNSNVFKNFSFDVTTSNIDHLLANIFVSKSYLESAVTIATEYKSFLYEHNTGEIVTTRDCHFSSHRFRTQHLMDGFQVVSVCPKDLKPCFYYWRKKTGCTSANCEMIHVCRSFLFDSNHQMVMSCGQCHTFGSMHNLKVLRKSHLHSLSTEQILLILRLRYPQVCEEYMKGNCADSEDHCRNVHICSKFILGICNEGCSKNHEDGLKTKRAKQLMKLFHISEKNFRNCIVIVLPIQKRKNKKGTRKRDSTVSKNDTIVAKVVEVSHDLHEEHAVELTEEERSAINDSDAAKPGLAFSSLKKSATSFVEPSEIDVFAYIMEQNGFVFTSLIVEKSRLFGDLRFRSGDKARVTEVVSDWFEKHKSTFRIVREEANVCGERYYLCVDTIAPCYEYWANSCRNRSCDKFHFCKKFLHGIQHSGISCPYNHSFKEQHEQQLISKYNLRPLTEKQLTLLLKIRYPLVCERYLSSDGCADKNNICQCVHVCGDFLEGKCTKPDGLCNYNHESGLTGNQAIRLMKEFHIDFPEDFKKCIIYWKADPKNSWNYQSRRVTLNADFNWLTNEAICYKYINGECDLCNVFHLDTGLPYAWQYYDNGSWNMFDASLNMEIEKFYCDPNNESFDSYEVDKSRPKRLIIQTSWNWRIAYFGTTSVNIRRLSTKSSVLINDTQAVGLTEWKWYWKNGTKWDEYTKWTTSYSIEKAFLGTPEGTFTFSTDEFKYSLSFTSMLQQNMDGRYLTKREVRRRPVFKRKADLKSVTQVIAVKNELPCHWPINDPSLDLKGGQIDVDLKTRTKIENSFTASMSYSVHVVDVAEVCNADFYESYQSKKHKLKAKVGSYNVNELSLYHGTDHTVVDGICAQNFDWRLCGKNAIAYGQGSYFAKNASYSHNYTTPDSNNLRYMFVAQVLVGRYTKGNTTMKRPPSVNPSADAHTLYDSCVDNETNPSIYVIFERDQCYPQYLITYRDIYSANYYNTQYPVTRNVSKQRPKPLKTPSTTSTSTSSSYNSRSYYNTGSSSNTRSSNSNSSNNSNSSSSSSSNNNNNNSSNNQSGCVLS